MVSTVDHDAILEQVRHDGVFSFHYAFLVVIAAGIATIGLLLNSPAVIIGAMLLSPLMGPIVLTGFSLATIDVAHGRRGLAAVLAGAAIALVVAAIIVFASPVREATPEILARTRPNLFDLIVAILSGAAGGYAMIRGRGGAIVGVAIATALMPPLAVVGYGLAAGQPSVAKGAAMLFTTNMVAIAVSAGVVAEWYGFGRSNFRRALARQSLLALLALAPLAVPLFFSLKAIAWETFATRSLRQAVESAMLPNTAASLSEFRVSFQGEVPSASALVLTEAYDQGLRERARRNAAIALGNGEFRMTLDQILVNDANRAAAGSGVALPVAAESRLLDPARPAIAAELRAAFPYPLQAVDVDDEARRVTLFPAPTSAASLAALHAMERTLAANYTDWTLRIVPPAMALPPIAFATSSTAIDAGAQDRLADVIWALRAWRVEAVAADGYASSEGRGTGKLALDRAHVVGRTLNAAGIAVTARGIYPAPEQRRLERERGMEAFRIVEIRIPPSPPYAATPMVKSRPPANRGFP